MTEMLQFGDASELAHKIRELLGVGDFEEVEAITPQFDRINNETVSVMPKDAAWLDTLKKAPLGILTNIGLQRWDEDENLWLFPAEWYDYIPEGYEIVDINGQTERFERGKSDDDRRYGALPYGILVEEPTP